MLTWLALLLAAAGISMCLFLWFRDVRRIMTERKSTVESAAGQYSSCRQKMAGANNDPEAKEVLGRSERIYRQAVDLYDGTLKKPWILLPALLMGFRFIP
ncbi:MAG: hypothetical protein IJO94_01525 [Firmicutes bacterium]|nr:hypothetical protein [Bacillota bacterium]MBQ4092398.1 hypothetical protein [Bacillota bacterium]MBQ6810065.1 hypothetical protein [Bacillota bacterium]